jgi:hypothetical protein
MLLWLLLNRPDRHAYSSDVNSVVMRLLSHQQEKAMKLQSPTWKGTALFCLLVNFCVLAASASPRLTQLRQTADAISQALIASDGPKTPALLKVAAAEKKNLHDQYLAQNEPSSRPPSPVILPEDTVLTVRLNEPVGMPSMTVKDLSYLVNGFVLEQSKRNDRAFTGTKELSTPPENNT